MSRCTQCGSCCRHIQFKLRVPDLKDQEFYRARGFTVRGEKVVDEVEPFPDGKVFIGRGSIIDVTEWGHKPLRKQK